MATDWTQLTPEQKAELNAKRREKYAVLSDSDKERARLHSRANKQVVAERSGIETFYTPEARSFGREAKARGGVSTEYAANMLVRIERRKRIFATKCRSFQAWAEGGGRYPWPGMEEKLRTSELFDQIATVLSRTCSQCGTKSCRDQNWRLSPKKDFLAFVPFQEQAYERVTRNPSQYSLYCPNCAFTGRLFLFHWLFGDSDRNGAMRKTRTGFEKVLTEQYPEDETLRNKIRSKDIRSLTCEIRGPHGPIPSFIRKNQFYAYVGANPRPIYGKEFQANPSRGPLEETKAG